MLLLGLLGGCSAFKLGYGQGPNLAYWWLDGYVGFDAAQAPRVKDELQRWFAWHQQTQLTDYAAHLAQARTESAQPLPGERLCRLTDRTRDLLQPAVERLLPAAAVIVLSLKPAQLDKMDARYQERTAEMRAEMLPADPNERQQATFKRTVKRFEGFYGSLSREQREMVAQNLQAKPFDVAAWLARRERRHQEMMSTLRALVREQPPAAQAQERLRQLIRRFDGRAPLEPMAEALAVKTSQCELAAQVHNSSTAAQRRFLADKLQGWETDLLALAQQAPVAMAAGVRRGSAMP